MFSFFVLHLDKIEYHLVYIIGILYSFTNIEEILVEVICLHACNCFVHKHPNHIKIIYINTNIPSTPRKSPRYIHYNSPAT